MNVVVCSVGRGVWIEAGVYGDFEGLKRFHYRAGRPGGVKRVWVARYGPARQTVGVLVETLPALNCMLRNYATGGRYLFPDRRLAAGLLNREVRCLSRVVVHPVFRGIGLAVTLVRYALEQAETPLVEALAAMGRVHPFFELAGMRAYDRPMNADAVRMTAALEAVGLDAAGLCHEKIWGDVVGVSTAESRAFLARELRRYLRQQDGEMALGTLIGQARARLLSQPVYYLWKR